MKPFDLEAAKAGEKVVTRDGREARYLGEIKNRDYPLAFAINEGSTEYTQEYTVHGKNNTDNDDSSEDLFMATEKKKLFIGISQKTYGSSNDAHLTTSAYPTTESIKEIMIDGQIVEIEIDI